MWINNRGVMYSKISSRYFFLVFSNYTYKLDLQCVKFKRMLFDTYEKNYREMIYKYDEIENGGV